MGPSWNDGPGKFVSVKCSRAFSVDELQARRWMFPVATNLEKWRRASLAQLLNVADGYTAVQPRESSRLSGDTRQVDGEKKVRDETASGWCDSRMVAGAGGAFRDYRTRRPQAALTTLLVLGLACLVLACSCLLPRASSCCFGPAADALEDPVGLAVEFGMTLSAEPKLAAQSVGRGEDLASMVGWCWWGDMGALSWWDVGALQIRVDPLRMPREARVAFTTDLLVWFGSICQCSAAAGRPVGDDACLFLRCFRRKIRALGGRDRGWVCGLVRRR